MTLDSDEVEALLSKLCIELGFCLPPAACARLRQHPSPGVDAFTDSVFVAEQLDPQAVDRRLYRQARALVRDAFENHLDRHVGPRLPRGR